MKTYGLSEIKMVERVCFAVFTQPLQSRRQVGTGGMQRGEQFFEVVIDRSVGGTHHQRVAIAPLGLQTCTPYVVAGSR